MSILRRLRRALTRRATFPEAVGGYGDSERIAGSIDDGVNYGRPVVIHDQMRQWPAETLSRYLNESAAQTFNFQFDTPQRSGADMAVQPVTEDPLREWNAATRRFVLENTHSTYQRNPIANRACKYTGSFVVGEGFSLTCRNKKVDELLQAFIKNPDNQVRKYERQAVIDLLVDGELLLRFFTERGETVMVPYRPWELMGIKTEVGFFRRAETYEFQFDQRGGDAPDSVYKFVVENVPASDMLHVTINNHGYELRGRPELYALLPWLRAYKEWLENRARQNHWRNALLWWVKVATSAPGVIAQKLTQYRRPPSPGSVLVTSDKEEWSALTNPTGGSDAAEDGRQIKLMVAAGFGLPEYFLADGSNTNLASATKQQLPALTTFGEMQRVMIEEVWTPVFKRVIQNAIEAGKLPAECPEEDPDGEATGETCATEDAFEVSYEPLQQADILNIAQAMKIAQDQGWVSSETATREIGQDPGIEKKRIARERKEDMDAMARGEMPMPPNMMDPNMAMPDENEEDDDAVQPETDKETPVMARR